MKGFASDNSSGVHPKVLAAMAAVNQGHVYAYGNDPTTEKAIDLLRQHFGEHSEVFFVFNGTGANVLCLSQVLQSTDAVICADTAHLYEHECGAPEKFVGCKIIPAKTTNGKLTVEAIKQVIKGVDDAHYSQPKLISLAQITEMGTCYSPDELTKITDFAHSNNMLVHMDGSRIFNAACALDLPLKAFTKEVGIDLLSCGGTKNGLMCAEAVIFFDPKLAPGFKYRRKQGMQVASKMRFIAAQFIALFDNHLWHQNAAHANKMAQRLARGLENLAQGLEGLENTATIKLLHQPAANMLFATLPHDLIEPLQQQFIFYVMQQMDQHQHLVRLVCSFDTAESDVDSFIAAIKNLLVH